MKSTPKLIKHFLLILMLSLFLLLGFNLILLATVGQKFASSGSPWTSAEEVAASLTPSGSGFSLSEAGADTLLKSHCRRQRGCSMEQRQSPRRNPPALFRGGHLSSDSRIYPGLSDFHL